MTAIEVVQGWLDSLPADSPERPGGIRAVEVLRAQQRLDEGFDAARLSRMMFEAREQLEMWADVVMARSGKCDTHLGDLIHQIDNFRVAQGWSRWGFGGENDPGFEPKR